MYSLKSTHQLADLIELVYIEIPIDLGIISSKNPSSLKNKEDGTKNVDSNSIDSITMYGKTTTTAIF